MIIIATVEHSVILQGGGGHAKVVIDCLMGEGKKILAVFDSKYKGQLLGIPRFEEYDAGFSPDAKLLIAIGNNATRKKLAGLAKHQFDNTVHPSAIVSRFASIGIGCMILHRSIVQADTVLGNHVILNTGAQVDHDGKIGDFVHVAPGAVLCGTVSVGEGTLIGSGAVVLPGIKIGKWATIAAGAVITKDVDDFAVVAGVPGEIIKMMR